MPSQSGKSMAGTVKTSLATNATQRLRHKGIAATTERNHDDSGKAAPLRRNDNADTPQRAKGKGTKISQQSKLTNTQHVAKPRKIAAFSREEERGTRNASHKRHGRDTIFTKPDTKQPMRQATSRKGKWHNNSETRT